MSFCIAYCSLIIQFVARQMQRRAVSTRGLSRKCARTRSATKSKCLRPLAPFGQGGSQLRIPSNRTCTRSPLADRHWRFLNCMPASWWSRWTDSIPATCSMFSVCLTDSGYRRTSSIALRCTWSATTAQCMKSYLLSRNLWRRCLQVNSRA